MDMDTNPTECDCGNRGDCNFCLDRDYPAPSPRAMEHFLDTGCTAGDEPGHLSDPAPVARLTGMHLTLLPPVTHEHSWVPVPNECGIYTCSCGWFGLREPIDGSITARATLRLVKRLIWQCYGCSKMTDICDDTTQLCPSCTRSTPKIRICHKDGGKRRHGADGVVYDCTCSLPINHAGACHFLGLSR